MHLLAVYHLPGRRVEGGRLAVEAIDFGLMMCLARKSPPRQEQIPVGKITSIRVSVQL